MEAPDGAALIDLLQTPRQVLLLDAVVGADPPGTVVLLPEGAWPERRATSLSSHGIGVAAAVGLARTLTPDRMAPSVRVLGVSVAPPRRFTTGLSEAVEAAVPEAVRRCREILEASRA
jgi:hydrogenase maturation protease